VDEKYIVSKMNEFLHTATRELAGWLGKMLPQVTKNWWQECVLGNLSFAQRNLAVDNEYSSLERLDLAALLRITDRSWYDMRSFAFLPTSERECIREMFKVRNIWAHCAGCIPEKDAVGHDINTLKSFFTQLMSPNALIKEVEKFYEDVSAADFASLPSEPKICSEAESTAATSVPIDAGIKEKDRVYLTGSPDTRGMVFSVTEINGIKKYEVFVDGDLKTFYDGQIKLIETPSYHWLDLDTFQSYLSAYQINNPSAGNLYSLNSARIDFVPYQFRPALKLIKSDEPRILIADSVGVGKTIEAGLIIKELEARNELDNVLIICPKPLVAERKWEIEMKRFDEEFTPLDGQALRQIISDTDRDGEWPSRFNKSIIPYSILDNRVYQGETIKKKKSYGLLDLDPAPHFDLVIIDEAHHIRNGSLDKEKAFAYKCVRYFCEHADAVVMLTATPLQTSDDDLFTLLNVLRPDVVMDKDVFRMMSLPNAYISRCSRIIRGAAEGWQQKAIDELENLAVTQWGDNVICKNPLYIDVINRLQKAPASREERVKLVSDIESLHSFNTMLNRTRRKDIQDFCVRRTFTVETNFTEIQTQLHDELLKFEFSALSILHNARSVPFMMSTIRRQAASCIFGLAPHIRDIIDRRFVQLCDDPEFDIETEDFENIAEGAFSGLAKHVLELADNLPEDDPKFDSIKTVIFEKQKYDNNKIILFSTFRYTLAYIKRKLEALNLRVAQIDGSVKDEIRRDLRERFELPKTDSDAIDIMLFTEVGSEGLDYQFCDTMINYDLPWNPMRIEQRIGRIDRRGQKSEAVNIYNIITADTVDADIYSRCLMRIGVFERSIGECEEVLGEIGSRIEQIVADASLTDAERRVKLEQMADNEVRRLQELSRLEDEEKELFGFDLSNYTVANEIKEAENPWISPSKIQHLVESYLSFRLGEGQFIIGESDLKRIRLSKNARDILRDDFRKLSDVRSAVKRRWDWYLKGTEPMHTLTFVPEIAEKERNAFFITAVHPLVKQAALYFSSKETAYIQLRYYSDTLPKGLYAFSVYAWNYIGLNPKVRLVPVCQSEIVENELTEILQDAESCSASAAVDSKVFSTLENRQVSLWMNEKKAHIAAAKMTASYKLESIGGNYRSRKRSLEKLIQDTFDENIHRMYRSELESASSVYERKVQIIEESTLCADIHTTLIANGIVEIKGE